MPADESTVGILFEIYELLLIIIRVYQKLNDDGIWLFSWPFVVVLLLSLLVGGRAW